MCQWLCSKRLGGGDIASVVDEGGGEEDLISLLFWEVRDC